MSSVIESSILQFHTKTDDLPFPILYQNEKFGIFQFKMQKTEVTKVPLFILFTIDKTGSMNDVGKNYNTKLSYVKQTFKSMISYLSKLDVEVFIRVHSFNVDVNVDIENDKVTTENVKELCKKIDNLEAEGPTNIEIALKSARDTLFAHKDSYPDQQAVHIFMTDGHPTIGDNNPSRLFELVNQHISNIRYNNVDVINY
jgi:hypothetical protein